MSGGTGGGNWRLIPSSESMVVVTNQKIKRRNAMSAIEPALISCNSRRAMRFLFQCASDFRYDDGQDGQSAQQVDKVQSPTGEQAFTCSHFDATRFICAQDGIVSEYVEAQ